MVTGKQVRRLRQKLMQGKTQEAAAITRSFPTTLTKFMIRSGRTAMFPDWSLALGVLEYPENPLNLPVETR